MDEKKLISIIIPVYNSSPYLERCLDSIKNQTYENIQVIIVDDGSTDNSADICQKYCNDDNRFMLITKTNGGATSARNAGLKCAKGEYVGFVDSDDWIDKNMYEVLYSAIERSGADVVTSRYYLINDSSMSNIPKEGFYNDSNKTCLYENLFLDGMTGIISGLCDKLYKREILIKYQAAVDETISYAEDAACTYPLILGAGAVCVLNTPLYHYDNQHCSSPRTIKADYFESLKMISRILYRAVLESGHPDILIPQLNKYLSSLLEYGLSNTFGEIISNVYLFPYEFIPQNSNVVLYGAGKMGQSYYCQLVQNRYCNIVGWVDQNVRKALGCEVDSIDSIVNYEYDVVLICISNTDIAESISSILVGEYKVEPEKIKWFFPKTIPNAKCFELYNI